MLKNKIIQARDFILKNYKIFFPIIIVLVVAVTVLTALNLGSDKEADVTKQQESSSEVLEESQAVIDPAQIPLMINENQEIENLIAEYYKAKGDGDTQTMLSLCDVITETDLLYYTELSKYIDTYEDLEIFTKTGPEEDSVIAYVYLKMGIKDYCSVPGYEAHYLCRNQQGSYYIKNQNSCTEEEKEFIKKLNEQVDVVEFNNKVNVEYDELMAQNPELLEYLGIFGEQVQVAVGVVLAEQNVEETAAVETPETSEQNTQELPSEPAETEPVVKYAKATTTVNVRSSDSENADKLGKLTGGSKVQVQEVRVNGWTKILFENKDGYVKSEYLAMEESAGGFASIGTVVANTNINVRAGAGENAERLGVLAGGETAELIALEGDWCKIKYNGLVGYVKAEYVTRQ